MKYIRDEVIKVAFVNMMNKLIFSRKVILKPFYDSLQIANADEAMQQIRQFKEKLEHNAERKDTIRKLRAQGIIDSTIYNQEIGRIDKQSEEYRTEITALTQADISIRMIETEKLLNFVESVDVISEYSDSLFNEHVDSIVVYSRSCIGFKLKCGLKLREALCTDMK